MIDDTAYTQRIDTLCGIVRRQEARIVELEARLHDANCHADENWDLADKLDRRLAAVIALCDDPGGPVTWSFTHDGRHGLYADDVRAAATGEDQ